MGGEGEIVDGLDGITREGLADEVVEEGFDFGDHFGFFSALEEGLDDLAVGGVFGGIDFDGELTHAAELFFRGNGDAERGVGAVGFPVFGGGADIFSPEDHGDVLALERAFEDGAVFTGFLEGIVGRGGVGHG